MMTLTCDAAGKLVKQLMAEKDKLYRMQDQNSQYVSTMADREYDRPEYSFEGTQHKITELMGQIIKLKNAIHQFNTNTVLNCGYTVSEALIKMSFLNDKVKRLDQMRAVPEKVRSRYSMRSDPPEYSFRNYDVRQVEAAYAEALKELTELQQEVNKVNATIEFDVEIDL